MYVVSFWFREPNQFVYGRRPNEINSKTLKFLEAIGSVSTTLSCEANCNGVYFSKITLSILMLPDNFFCTFPNVRKSVDFPIPFIPTMAHNSPLWRLKLIALAIAPDL